MTHEEAVGILISQAIVLRRASGKSTLERIRNEAICKAVEALKKQIPKKPTRGKYGHTECACCGWIVESFCGDLEKYPFCPNCGQAIDWEVSE